MVEKVKNTVEPLIFPRWVLSYVMYCTRKVFSTHIPHVVYMKYIKRKDQVKYKIFTEIAVSRLILQPKAMKLCSDADFKASLG